MVSWGPTRPFIKFATATADSSVTLAQPWVPDRVAPHPSSWPETRSSPAYPVGRWSTQESMRTHKTKRPFAKETTSSPRRACSRGPRSPVESKENNDSQGASASPLPHTPARPWNEDHLVRGVPRDSFTVRYYQYCQVASDSVTRPCVAIKGAQFPLRMWSRGGRDPMDYGHVTSVTMNR
ncbi:hypothetical protein ISCGN_019494 [Ixodes scapularis]